MCGGWGRLRRRTQQHAACKATDSKHSPHPDSCNPQPSQQSLQSAAQGKHTLAARNQWLSPPLTPRISTARTPAGSSNRSDAALNTEQHVRTQPDMRTRRPKARTRGQQARSGDTISSTVLHDLDRLAARWRLSRAALSARSSTALDSSLGSHDGASLPVISAARWRFPHTARSVRSSTVHLRSSTARPLEDSNVSTLDTLAHVSIRRSPVEA